MPNTGQSSARMRTAISLLTPMLFALSACDERSSTTATPKKPAVVEPADPDVVNDALSPAATVRLVNQHRREGRLSAIGPFLLPDQRLYIIELIQSVDRLRWANQVLTESVAKRLGESTAKAFDRPKLANIIGVFSWDVAVIDETINDTIDADRATVSFQVGDRLPLERVQLVRRAAGWVIETDPPIPGIAGELLKLADATSAVARRVDQREMTMAQIARELDASQAPVMRRLSVMLNEHTTDPAG